MGKRTGNRHCHISTKSPWWNRELDTVRVTVGPIVPQGWLKVSLRDVRRSGKQARIARRGIRLPVGGDRKETEACKLGVAITVDQNGGPDRVDEGGSDSSIDENLVLQWLDCNLVQSFETFLPEV